MLRVLPPSFKPVNNLICCKADLMWVENAQHRYSTRFTATLQDMLHVFGRAFYRTAHSLTAHSDSAKWLGDEAEFHPPPQLRRRKE